MKPNRLTDTTLPQENTPHTLSLPAIPIYDMLSNEQLIDNLYRVINEQDRKIGEFQHLLATYMEKIKTLSTHYDIQKTYSKEIFDKLEEARNQNYRLKVQIGLVKSDNLILKSKLGFQESRGKSEREDPNSENRNGIQGTEEEKQRKIKNLQFKMANVRKIMKNLMKALQKIIISNEDGQNQILDEITQLMSHIK